MVSGLHVYVGLSLTKKIDGPLLTVPSRLEIGLELGIDTRSKMGQRGGRVVPDLKLSSRLLFGTPEKPRSVHSY